jgi:hypothetical protein
MISKAAALLKQKEFNLSETELERNDASLKEQLKCILESICNPSQGLLT